MTPMELPLEVKYVKGQLKRAALRYSMKDGEAKQDNAGSGAKTIKELIDILENKYEDRFTDISIDYSDINPIIKNYLEERRAPFS